MEKVAIRLNSNVKFYSVGRLKTSENHRSEWVDDYEITYTVPLNKVSKVQIFEFKFSESGFLLST